MFVTNIDEYRYVHPFSGLPVCRQIDIIAVKSSNGFGVLDALNTAVENGLKLKMSDLHPDNEGAPSLIMANFDGASVNFQVMCSGTNEAIFWHNSVLLINWSFPFYFLLKVGNISVTLLKKF